VAKGSVDSGTRPAAGMATAQSVYSIGAVSSMLETAPATLRTWEERYGVVIPSRTATGHRLYSRDQVDRLRSIKAQIAGGMSAADAHRLLAEEIRLTDLSETPEGAGGPRLLILVAERDPYSAELIEFLLRTEGFVVDVALDAEEARLRFGDRQPHLTVVEFLIDGGSGEELCRWLKSQAAAPVLAISSLDAADRALRAGADAFLAKPVRQLQFVSAVKDLLGVSAMLERPVPTLR
jgi:CheY-like chemotaxis protein